MSKLTKDDKTLLMLLREMHTNRQQLRRSAEARELAAVAGIDAPQFNVTYPRLRQRGLITGPNPEFRLTDDGARLAEMLRNPVAFVQTHLCSGEEGLNYHVVIAVPEVQRRWRCTKCGQEFTANPDGVVSGGGIDPVGT